GSRSYREAANQVVQPNCAPTNMRWREVHDHRLASRLAKLPQAAEHEREDERYEARGQHDGDREECEACKGGHDEGPAPQKIGKLGGRNINQNRRKKLDREQDSVLAD